MDLLKLTSEELRDKNVGVRTLDFLRSVVAGGFKVVAGEATVLVAAGSSAFAGLTLWYPLRIVF